MKYVWFVLFFSVLIFSGCGKDGLLEDNDIDDNYLANKYPPLPPGETSPDAVVARLEKYLSQKDFENFFQYRFGTDKWAEIAKDHHQILLPDRHDYYSYDNFKRAVWELAYFVYEIEYRIESWNNAPGYSWRSTVTNKATNVTTVIYEEPEFYEPWNTVKPILKVTVDYGSFLGEGSDNDRSREIAGVLANFVQETSGGTGGNPGQPGYVPLDRETKGLFHNEEMGLVGDTSGAYVQESADWPPQPGHSYHGRGPKQISYNFNYGLCSAIIYGDKMVLLKNPELIVEQNPPGG
ncbi:MAG: chitinase, partial [Treponema sp.]|nr:chitinase [Treponema sp.]